MLPVIAGMIAATMGGLVLIGWAYNLEILKRFLPNLVAMNPVVASCVLLAGVSLALRQEVRSVVWFKRFTGALVFLVGAVKLFDVVASADSGIDRFLFPAKLAGADTLNINPMAPNTALGLLILGVAVFCLVYRNRWVILVGQVCGVVVALISLIGIFGYVLHLPELIAIAEYFPMALNTAIVLLILAVGLLCSQPIYEDKAAPIIATREESGQGIEPQALAIGVVGLVLSSALWWGVYSQHQNLMREQLSGQARIFVRVLANEMEDIRNSQRRMAGRWKLPGGSSKNLWFSDARALLTDFPFLIDVQWIDARSHIRWKATDKGEDLEIDQPLNLNLDPEAADRREAARRDNRFTVSPARKDKSTGALYFGAYVPLFEDTGGFDGLLLFHVGVSGLFSHIYDQSDLSANIAVLSSAEPLFTSGQPKINANSNLHIAETAKLDDLDLLVDASPTEAFLRDNQTRLPQAVLTISLLVTFLATALVHQNQRTARIHLQLKHAATLISDQEERLLDLVTIIPDATVLVSANGKIIMVNRQLCTMFEYEENELIGQEIENLIPESLHHKHVELRKQFIDAPRIRVMGQDIDLFARKKSGGEFAVEISLSPLRIRDGLAVIATIRDRTARIRADEIVKAAEVSNRASAAKSQFLAAMSHEIRTPLNGIIGNLELLTQTPLDSEQFELLDDADKASKSLLALIGNILDFSKIEAGKLVIEDGEFSLSALVEEAVHVLQSRARQKNIFIVATFTPDVPEIVRGDATRLRQILLNLIGNAVKFTEQGGIHVRASVLGWDQNVCEMQIVVHDSGVGFEKWQAELIFNPFKQVGSQNHAAQGTGLGLAICRSLVEAIGGAIGCDSAPGEGATFWFTLPLAVERLAAPVPPADLSAQTVLLVSNGKSCAASIEEYFSSRGAAVISANSPSDASAIIVKMEAETRRRFDACLFTVDSEEMGAPELLRQLRNMGIVVLLVGEEDTFRARRLALRTGYNALIPARSSMEILDRNIRVLMGQGRARERRGEANNALEKVFTPALSGKRVLVLEDRLVNQTVIQKQLRKLDIRCSIVANGLKGLEKLETESFDLILCDCSMPVMNGYDFTRALRQKEKSAGDGQHVPVVALTANAFREDAEKCFEAGMDDFVSKPVTFDRLGAVLVKWLGGKKDEITFASSSGGTNIIDIVVLRDLLGSDDHGALVEVLTEFAKAINESWAAIQVEVANMDDTSLANLAHGAKGEARSAGATNLSELYAKLEQLSKVGDRKGIENILSSIPAEIDRIKSFIASYVEEGRK